LTCGNAYWIPEMVCHGIRKDIRHKLCRRYYQHLVAEFWRTRMHDRGFWCNVDNWKFCCTHSLWHTVMVWLHLFSVICKGGNLVVLTQYNEYKQHRCESRHRVVHDRQVLADVIQVVVILHYHGGKQEANGYPQLYIHIFTHMHFTDPWCSWIRVS